MRYLLGLVLCVLTISAVAQAQDVSEAELIATLQGDDSRAAAQAATALGELEGPSQQVVTALIKALQDKREGEVRTANFGIIFGEGPYSRPVALFARDALVEIGEPAAAELANLLADPSQTESNRSSVLRMLEKIGPDAKAALPTIVKFLEDESFSVRADALDTYLAVQEEVELRVKVLIARLADENPNMRYLALVYLQKLGPAAAAAVPKMIPLLDDPDERVHYYSAHYSGLRLVRYDAANALAALGEAAQPALPKLRTMMRNDPNRLTRIAAAFAVARLQDDPQPGIEVLAEHMVIDSTNFELPEESAFRLEALGEKARPALPALRQALKHEMPLVRLVTVEAIIAIDPEGAEASLLPLVQDQDVDVQCSVIRELSRLPSLSDDAITAFIAALDVRDEWGDWDSHHVRYAAAVALGELGAQAKRALPRLVRLVQEDNDQDVRDAAREAIESIRGK